MIWSPTCEVLPTEISTITGSYSLYDTRDVLYAVENRLIYFVYQGIYTQIKKADHKLASISSYTRAFTTIWYVLAGVKLTGVQRSYCWLLSCLEQEIKLNGTARPVTSISMNSVTVNFSSLILNSKQQAIWKFL